MRSLLLIGFDSAWSPSNKGAIVGVFRQTDGTWLEFTSPECASFDEAQSAIDTWRADYSPDSTLIVIDQPTIVANESGQRPVENIVSSTVGRRRSAIQPASRSKSTLFGPDAPIWPFLGSFGGPMMPDQSVGRSCVVETYPVLSIVALAWLTTSPTGKETLPKYNPTRKTFSIEAWQFICSNLNRALCRRGLQATARWVKNVGSDEKPNKTVQDRIDACICLLVGLHMADEERCIFVGNVEDGYIVCPYSEKLERELIERCTKTHRKPADWIRTIRLDLGDC